MSSAHQRFRGPPPDSGDALAYVRERYNLPNGDLDRAENQCDVVRAILDKAAQPRFPQSCNEANC